MACLQLKSGMELEVQPMITYASFIPGDVQPMCWILVYRMVNVYQNGIHEVNKENLLGYLKNMQLTLVLF